MFTVIVGAASALIFGSADFLGGLASKRLSPIRVTAIGAVSGLVILFAAEPLLGGRWSWEAMLYGGISGVTGAFAITLLYACLAIGPMSILSPLTALVSAFVPLTAGVIRGDRLPVFGYVAIGIALIAVVLVGFVKEKGAVRATPRALLMAVGSGTMIGAFLILVDLTPDDSGLVPLIANRTVNGIIMFSVVGVLMVVARRRKAHGSRLETRGVSTGSTGELGGSTGEIGKSTREVSTSSTGEKWGSTGELGGSTGELGKSTGEVSTSSTGSNGCSTGESATPRAGMLSIGWRAGFWVAVAAGAIDATANSVVLFGLRIGDLSVMAVLSALYPAGTIILAAIVLRERIAPVQWVGLVLALIAAAMLALA